MLSTWLRHTGHRCCTVFCTGWSMDETPFQDWAWPEGDFLLLASYHDLRLPDLALLENYQERRLIAWSMGVWVAGTVFGQDDAPPFDSATAIGGTLQPIDETTGIPGSMVSGMIRECSSEMLKEFHRSMFDQEEESQRFQHNRPQRPPVDAALELTALTALYQQYGPGRDIFSRRIITGRDRIFSARNQSRAWGRNRAELLQVPHFPFYRWGGLLPPQTRAH